MSSDRWQQIEALYQAARDPHKRAGVLRDADPELRSEVEALLAQDAQDDGGSTQTIFGAGAQLGPYKIDAPIGAGGMGEVFRATDTRLHRTVAIKILPQDKVADPERKRRFLQEARAASALNLSPAAGDISFERFYIIGMRVYNPVGHAGTGP